MGRSALDGVLVVEIGERRAVAACGLLLAQAGATVVVVEPEDAGDHAKWKSRPTLMAGKESLSLSDANDRIDDAIRAADVVLLSSDLDRAALSGLVARIGADRIVCDITGFGPDAPPERRGWPEKIMQAYCGVADITGPAEAPPTPSDVAVLEFHSGIYGAAGVLAALRVRDRDGIVQRVDISMHECGINSLATFLPLHYGGKKTRRAGNRHPMAAPWNAFRARDGWVLLCSAKDEHWMKLCDLMGCPEHAREGPLVKLADRVDRVDEVDAVVNGWTGRHSVEECVERLSSGDIASGPITEVQQFETDANIVHRRMARRLRDPTTERDMLVAGTPLKASRTAGVEPGPAPLRGSADNVRFDPRKARHPSNISSSLPCGGLLVLEIGQYTTAPLAARQLSSLGAEVLKIEPLDGEASRAWPPHQAGTGYFFAMSNSGKRSVSLNLRDPDDKALFTALVRKADVLVENMKPGSLARLGFSPEQLEKLNPRLVYCGISGFGADSRHPGRPAFDTVVQAMSGLMDLTRVGSTPMKLGISAGDITGGILALYAILAMLIERDCSGRGQSIDLAMQDAAVWLTQTVWNGERRDACTILPVSDGFIAAATETGEAMTALSGLEKLDRLKASTRLREGGILAVPVRSIAEVAEDPETRGSGTVVQRTLDGLQWPLLGCPIRLSATAPIASDPIGALGEGKTRAEQIVADGRKPMDDAIGRRQSVGQLS